MIELMFATSAFSTALSLITLVHDGMLWPAFAFIRRHSEIQIHFFLFSICSTVGQLFIFYTIKNFGAVVFAIIMTARVLISIALSVTLYKHKVTSTGFFGLVVVVAAVGYRIKKQAEGRQLIKWEGMGEKSEKEIELVQERLAALLRFVPVCLCCGFPAFAPTGTMLHDQCVTRCTRS
jgi:adenosine 3'-phospho 5'-phosphosulfate transporter B2